MDQDAKQKIIEKYQRELDRGVRFWPDIIFKDALMFLAVFILLVLLAGFVGVHDPGRADPNSNFTPRPEWYFLFLFKFLALYGQIPVLGKIEWIAAILVPGIAMGILLLMPFIDHSPHRYYAKRALPLGVMFIIVLDIVLLTAMAEYQTVSGDGSQMPGMLQAIAGIGLPVISIFSFIIMAYALREKAAQAIARSAILFGLLMIGFAVSAMLLYPIPPKEIVEVPTTLAGQIAAGQDLYSIHCVECHGDDGSVRVIKGVAGLDGKTLSPINSKDVLYTLNDASLAEVIAYGRPEAGMNPFGMAYNPAGLTRGEIDYIVLFMRYNWDDRFEKPQVQALFPPLGKDETPTYTTHIAPIVKRYCVSCHRPGKSNNQYDMSSYETMLQSGENAGQNLIAGKPEASILIQVIQHHSVQSDSDGEEIGPMPPNRKLTQEIIDAFIRWVKAGLPK